MPEETSYIDILSDSLKRKKAVLEEICTQNRIQKDLLSEAKLDDEFFDRTLEEKERLILFLNELDSGFQSLFGHVRDVLEDRKAEYAVQIRDMQSMIAEIMELSIQIQKEEKENQVGIQKHFSKMKHELKQSKISKQAAYGYYKTMNQTNNQQSQFLDRKK